MRRIFFYYQKGMSGKWGPVIHYDDTPRRKDSRLVVDATQGPLTTDPVELQPDDHLLVMFDAFGELQRKYPFKEPTT